MWYGNSVLKEAFFVLFGIARAKDASVADNLELSSGSNQWSVSFSREAHDWEVDVFYFYFLFIYLFFKVLYSVSIRRGSKDRLWWAPSKK
jgi:hypothetical protein